MDATLKNHGPVPERDIQYYRQRHKNRVFEEIVAFFAEEAERRGITKKDIADRLRRDPAQITRWLSSPTNLTLDTISDILLALNAEMDHRVVRLSERPKANVMHPLIARVTNRERRPPQKATVRYDSASKEGAQISSNAKLKILAGVEN
jgi:transcriptional regulator with XRE-family HTH domain